MMLKMDGFACLATIGYTFEATTPSGVIAVSFTSPSRLATSFFVPVVNGGRSTTCP